MGFICSKYLLLECTYCVAKLNKINKFSQIRSRFFWTGNYCSRASYAERILHGYAHLHNNFTACISDNLHTEDIDDNVGFTKRACFTLSMAYHIAYLTATTHDILVK